MREELLRSGDRAAMERELIAAYRDNAKLLRSVYSDWECTVADGLDRLDDDDYLLQVFPVANPER